MGYFSGWDYTCSDFRMMLDLGNANKVWLELGTSTRNWLVLVIFGSRSLPLRKPTMTLIETVRMGGKIVNVIATPTAELLDSASWMQIPRPILPHLHPNRPNYKSNKRTTHPARRHLDLLSPVDRRPTPLPLSCDIPIYHVLLLAPPPPPPSAGQLIVENFTLLSPSANYLHDY